MGHDHHRHEHDKGLRTKLHWLLQIRKFWQSDVNREVFAMAAPAAGEHAVDVGAGMGPATVLAARRGARVTAVDPPASCARSCRCGAPSNGPVPA